MAVGRIGYRGDFWIYFDTNNVRRAFKGQNTSNILGLSEGNFGQRTQEGFTYKDSSGQWKIMDGNEVDNDQTESDGSIPRGIGVRGIRFYYNGPTVLDRIRGDIDDQNTSQWANVSLSITDEGESATLGWTAGTIRHLTRTFEIQRKEEGEPAFATIETGITGVSGNTYTDTPPEEGVWEYRVRERRTLSTGSQQTKLSNIATAEIEEPCTEITESPSNVSVQRDEFFEPFSVTVSWDSPSGGLPEGSHIRVTVGGPNNTSDSPQLSRTTTNWTTPEVHASGSYTITVRFINDCSNNPTTINTSL